ncbi:MAG: hypothetical protein JSR48_00285 [Verrucomicrobia bacterium]|nr:hypothetical protein [Verrucomicrobiota bacterium]
MKTTKPYGGFSLLEIVLVLFILGLMATAMVPSVREIVERARSEAETRNLDDLAATITSSFEATDLSGLNVAALPGTIGPGDTPTEFSTGTGAYVTTTSASWFAKVARLKGLVPAIGVAPTVAAQPAIAAIAFNGLGNPRLLFAGPVEAGQQRFLLVSLMSPAGTLVLPPYDGSIAWFDAIWNGDWENRTAVVPPYWATVLSPAQVAAWQSGPGGTTQLCRLSVRRIVLPKYAVTVNNNHPANAAFVSFNNVPNAFTAPANSGASVTPEILGGRLVTVNQGPAWPGAEVLRFHLHENATGTIQ